MKNDALNGIIYQVFSGRTKWASEIDDGGRVFEKMREYDWGQFKELGVEYIYFLGLWSNEGPIIIGEERGRDLREMRNRCPSPFAISDYRKTRKALGTIEELKKLIEHVQTEGFKVLVDFVPNHTGTNHGWVEKHPEFYALNEQAFIREFSGDVYKLNYDNDQLRYEMIEVLKFYQSLGANGVRVDMAHLVPFDFWEKAIFEIRKTGEDFAFFAEAYVDDLANTNALVKLCNLGFSGVYNEPLLRNLKRVIWGERPWSDLWAYIDYQMKTDGLKVVNYLSNHDDPVDEMLRGRVQAILGLLLTLPGWGFVFNGFLSGFEDRLGHHFVEILGENFDDRKMAKEIYRNMLLIRKSRPGVVVEMLKSKEGVALFRVKFENSNEGRLLVNLSERAVYVDEWLSEKGGLWWGGKADSVLQPLMSELYE